MFTLAVLTLLIPFIIKEHTIYTTQYIYGAIISPVLVMWFIDFLSENHNHTKFFDWLMTGLVISICPVSIIVGLIALLVIYFFPKTAYFSAWITSCITVFLLGVTPIYSGKINKSAGSFIAVINHGSFLDYFFIPLIMGYKIPWKVLYGKNLEKYPILRSFLKQYGIGVDRSSPESRLQANKDIKKALADGFSIAIFPEGTRMRGHQISNILLEFHNGAFNASVDSKRPIAPVLLFLTLPYSKAEKPFPLSPRRIYISFQELIYPEKFDSHSLKNETHKLMKNKLLFMRTCYK